MLNSQLERNFRCQDDDQLVMGKNVMVVDDDGSLRESLRYGLESYGLRVTLCENATEALLYSMMEEFDYIITDYDLPGLDGIDLIRRLRERSSFTTVIIGMSGNDLGETFLENGANDFLLKPFAPYTLAMMIDGGDLLI